MILKSSLATDVVFPAHLTLVLLFSDFMIRKKSCKHPFFYYASKSLLEFN